MATTVAAHKFTRRTEGGPSGSWYVPACSCGWEARRVRVVGLGAASARRAHDAHVAEATFALEPAVLEALRPKLNAVTAGAGLGAVRGRWTQVAGESMSDGPWLARDLGNVRLVAAFDDGLELIVFTGPANGVVDWRVKFGEGTPAGLIRLAVKAALVEVGVL